MEASFPLSRNGVWHHKMHIFTTNIPTFHSRYRRYVFITNKFHEFCWSTISGTSDDEKAPYGPKSMHIFIMSKIRHSHRKYDTRKWCGIKHGLNRAKVWPAGHLLVHFQKSFCLCVYQRRCSRYPMPKGGARRKLGCPARQVGLPRQIFSQRTTLLLLKYHGAPPGRKCEESKV
jgi:hypothetical protein